MPSEHSAATHSLPKLPRRTAKQAMAAALRLSNESECYERATIERCLAGLRALDEPAAAGRLTAQIEVDGVIARWRAAHPECRP